MSMFRVFKKDLERAKRPTDLTAAEGRKIKGVVASMLGPYGMYKLTHSGEIITIGKDVIDNIELGPMAEPLKKAVSEQYSEEMDGTKVAALLASNLLIKADELARMGIAPHRTMAGYREALHTALKVLDENTWPVERDDTDTLEDIVRTSLSNSPADRKDIVESVRDAILYLENPRAEDINVLAEEGGEGSEVILGLKLDYNRMRDDMPEELHNVKVALVRDIKPRKAENSMEMSIETAEDYERYSKYEEEDLQAIVDRLSDMGVGAVFSKGEIDDRAADMLSRAGIAAFQKISETDMKLLQEATDGYMTDVRYIEESDLGYVGDMDDSDEVGCAGGICHT